MKSKMQAKSREQKNGEGMCALPEVFSQFTPETCYSASWMASASLRAVTSSVE